MAAAPLFGGLRSLCSVRLNVATRLAQFLESRTAEGFRVKLELAEWGRGLGLAHADEHLTSRLVEPML